MKKSRQLYRRQAWFSSVIIHCVVAVFLVSATQKLPLTVVKSHHYVNAAVIFKNSHVTSLDTNDSASLLPQREPLLLVKPAITKKTANEHTAQTIGTQQSATPLVASPDGHASEPSGSIVVQFRKSPTLINSSDVKVLYPEQARQLMIEGIVKMRLTVSKAGRVIDAQILSGPYYGLRDAALMVARKLFFLPATDEHGQARTAKIDHEVVFRLKKQS